LETNPRRVAEAIAGTREQERGLAFAWMKIALIIAHTRNNVVVLFGTLKIKSFMLTEVKDCDLLIVVTSSIFLKRKEMLKEKSS